MELEDEGEWKLRDKLLLAEAVSTARRSACDERKESELGANGSDTNVDWAAISSFLRKYVPAKRLTSPASFGSKRCMAMFDQLLACHGDSGATMSMDGSLDRVVAALREEYMNHLRASILAYDARIQASAERIARIQAGELDDDLLREHREQHPSSSPAVPHPDSTAATDTSLPSATPTTTTTQSKRKAESPHELAENGGTTPTTDTAPPPVKRARTEPSDEAAPVEQTTTSAVPPTTSPEPGIEAVGASQPRAQTPPPSPAAAAPVPPPATGQSPTVVAESFAGGTAASSETSAAAREAKAEVEAEVEVEADQVKPVTSPIPEAEAEAEADQQEEQSAMLLAMAMSEHGGLDGEPLPLPVVSSLSSAPASPASLAQQETWAPYRTSPSLDDVAASLASSSPSLSSPAAQQPPQAGQPSPNAGASFSTDLLWEKFERTDDDDAGQPPQTTTTTTTTATTPPTTTTNTEADVMDVERSLGEAGPEGNETNDGGGKVEQPRAEVGPEAVLAQENKKEEGEAEVKVEEKPPPPEPVVAAVVKRPRGRPRKHPLPTTAAGTAAAPAAPAKRTYKKRGKSSGGGAETEATAGPSRSEGREASPPAAAAVAPDVSPVNKAAVRRGRGAAKSDAAENAQVMKTEKRDEENEEAREEKVKGSNTKSEADDKNAAEAKNENDKSDVLADNGADHDTDNADASSGGDLELEAEAAVRRVEMEGVRRVLETVKRHHYAVPFLQPVSVDDVPDYPNVIYRPMDFGTITRRLDSGEIGSKIEFLRDMYLLFQNAFMFNPKGSDIYVMASTLKTLTKKEMREVDKEVAFVRASFPPPRPKKKSAAAEEEQEQGAGSKSAGLAEDTGGAGIQTKRRR